MCMGTCACACSCAYAYACQQVALPRELATSAAGSLVTALGGGYSNYIAVSNTAIHRKCGGKQTLSCLVAAAVALLFFIGHPLFVIVGYVPTLVVAGICVYIGPELQLEPEGPPEMGLY